VKKTPAAIIFMVITYCCSALASDSGTGWVASGEWVSIDKHLFISLTGWTPGCINCCTTYSTSHHEYTGYYISKKSKKVIRVKFDNEPRIRYLSK